MNILLKRNNITEFDNTLCCVNNSIMFMTICKINKYYENFDYIITTSGYSVEKNKENTFVG